MKHLCNNSNIRGISSIISGQRGTKENLYYSQRRHSTEFTKEDYAKFFDACTNNITQVIKKYIKLGIDANYKDGYGRTALMWAAYYDNTEIVKVLIGAGANLDSQDNYGSTALVWAATYGNKVEIAQMLIKAGASLDIQNKGGETALIMAAFYGSEDTVRMLIDAGANLDTQDRSGYTALIWAAYHGSKGITKMLIKAGASTELRNKYNKTYKDYLNEKESSRGRNNKMSRKKVSSVNWKEKLTAWGNDNKYLFPQYMNDNIDSMDSFISDLCYNQGIDANTLLSREDVIAKIEDWRDNILPEVADSAVPVYNSDRIKWFADDSSEFWYDAEEAYFDNSDIPHSVTEILGGIEYFYAEMVYNKVLDKMIEFIEEQEDDEEEEIEDEVVESSRKESDMSNWNKAMQKKKQKREEDNNKIESKRKVSAGEAKFGFALSVGNEDLIEDAAVEDGVVIDWDEVGKDIEIIENNVMNKLNNIFILAVRHGHNSDDELVGNITVDMNDEHQRDILEDGLVSDESGEPYRTSSGSLNYVINDMDLYKGTSKKYDIDVTLEFFDADNVLGEVESKKKVIKR